MAKQESKVPYEDYEEYNDEDQYFNMNLSDKPKKFVETEDKREEPQYELKDKGYKRKNQKEETETAKEEKKEEKVVPVDNSLSYKEYKEKKIKETANLKQDVKKNVVVQNIQNESLKPTTKKPGDGFEIGTSNKQAEKKKQKAKEKQVDNLEAKLNAVIGNKVYENAQVEFRKTEEKAALSNKNFKEKEKEKCCFK